MSFSLVLLIFILLSEYLAIEKNNKNRRHTQSKFADHDCMSSIKAIK